MVNVDIIVIVIINKDKNNFCLKEKCLTRFCAIELWLAPSVEAFPWHWHCEPLSCAISGCSGPLPPEAALTR